MKKLHSTVNENDRITIEFNKNDNTITYFLEESKSRKRTKLVTLYQKSPSIREYFGGKGKTIRELYDFNRWNNKKLVKEMNWLWRRIEKITYDKGRGYEQFHQTYTVHENVWDGERCA